MSVVRWKEQTPDGPIIHSGAADGVDYTLCGYALEGECAEEGGDEETHHVNRGRISCPDCLRVIRFCKTIPAKMLARGDDQ